MLPLITPSHMRSAEQKAIARGEATARDLMERAAEEATHSILERFAPIAKKTVTVFCGPGNNGGDGFAIAHKLHDRGANISLYFYGEEKKLSPEAREHKLRCEEKKLLITQSLSALPQHCDIAIDALFGTGAHSTFNHDLAEVIRFINHHSSHCVAIDIPTGLNGESGSSGSSVVEADITITFGAVKTGLVTGRARDFVGELFTGDIGIDVAGPDHHASWWIEDKDVPALLPARKETFTKFDCGKVLVVGGSRGMIGAPVMSAEAALRAGCGMVVLAVPESERETAASFMPEIMTLGLEDDHGAITEIAYQHLRKRIAWCDVVAVGPGIGRSERTKFFVDELLADCEKPLVLDADGIFLVSPDALRSRAAKECVITPHAGELAILMGKDRTDIESNMIEAARSAAKEMNVTVLLKGAPGIVASAAGNIIVLRGGNAGMATAGTGDVLTGIIAGIAAQHCAQGRVEDVSTTSAVAGAWLAARAGDHARNDLTEYSMTARDITRNLHKAFRDLEVL